MNQPYERIIYEVGTTGVAFIRLNHPNNRNALDIPLRQELTRALEAAGYDDSVRVVILTGVGDHFCAGGDVKSIAEMTAQQARQRILLAHQPLLCIRNLEKPVIAMVHGFAAGAGMNVTLACDLVMAADDTRFIQSFVKVGLLSDIGGLYFLPRLIGMQRAKELVFKGGQLDAFEAERLGLVNRVLPRSELEPETLKLAESLAAGATQSLGMMKRLMNRGQDCSLDSFLEMEAGLQALCYNSAENKEGIQAFLQKRPPKFH